MLTERRIFAGTEDGVMILAEKQAKWDQIGSGLDAKFVGSLAAASAINTVYGAVEGDGLYVLRDGSTAWERCFTGDVRALAVDPNNPETVYAGTEPVHLFRSDDAGRSWRDFEGLQRLPDDVREQWWFPIYPHEGHACSICVSPHDSRIIYMSIEHGGIVRTIDGGDTWEDLSTGLEHLDVHMIAVDPVRPNLCYAAEARGFYRSDTEGHTWARSMSGLTRDYMHDFFSLPGASSTLFLATGNGSPPSWLRAGGAQCAIFRSRDSGLTWHQLGGGLADSMEHMVWNLVGDPADERRLYAGAGDYSRYRSDVVGGEVWVSEDLGDTWMQIHSGPRPVRSLCVMTPVATVAKPGHQLAESRP